VDNKQEKTGLSRREFIKAAGITAAGVMASSLVSGSAIGAPATKTTMASPRAVGANDRLNYAHIGVGGMGGGHLNSIKALASEMNLQQVAVCDVWSKKNNWAKETSGCDASQVYTDYRKLLENKDIDVVVIGTPDHWHAPIAIAAMQAGKHVYCEKPMTRTLDEAFLMHKTAKETGCLVQVGSQGCTDTKWHVAGKAVKDGKIGTALWAQGGYCRNNPHGEWNYNIDPDLTPDSCDWKMWLGNAPKIAFSPERFFRWRKYWDYGNGIIGDLWPHRLHPLMIAMNMGPDPALIQFPRRVACLGANILDTDANHSDPSKPYGDTRDVADTTQMIAEFPGGTMIYLAGATTNERGVEDMIRGNKATLYFGGGKVTVEPQRPFTDEVEQEELAVVGPGEDTREHHKNLIRCIREGGVPNCNIDLGLAVQTVVSMAEMSYRENKMAMFDPDKKKLLKS
jgi:predicted dehydrogenase